MSHDMNDVGGGGAGGDASGCKNETHPVIGISLKITGSAKILPLFSALRRQSRGSAADLRAGADDPSGDREPHAALVRRICTQLHTRFAVIARTQTAEEVTEAGVQLVVALEKFRVEGIARGASAKSVRGNVAGPDAALPSAGASQRLKSAFDMAMDDRMAVLVERNDQESVAKVTTATL